MKRLLTFACLALPPLLWAQVPSGISVDRQPAVANEALRVTVNFEAAGGLCGLRLDFGDGDVREFVVERFPSTVLKHYAAPGRYVVRAEGKGLLRGLSSALACVGAPRSAVVEVVGSSRDVGQRPGGAQGAATGRATVPAGATPTPAPSPPRPQAPSPASPPAAAPAPERAPTPTPAQPAGRPRDESLRVF